jgi:hypothetical protein
MEGCANSLDNEEDQDGVDSSLRTAILLAVHEAAAMSCALSSHHVHLRQQLSDIITFFSLISSAPIAMLDQVDLIWLHYLLFIRLLRWDGWEFAGVLITLG